jgi:hypothetical protein
MLSPVAPSSNRDRVTPWTPPVCLLVQLSDYRPVIELQPSIAGFLCSGAVVEVTAAEVARPTAEVS